MNAFALKVRHWFATDEVGRAREWQRLSSPDRWDQAQFEREFRTSPRSDRIIFGRASSVDGGWYWAGMSRRKFLQTRGLIVGGSGSGKSYLGLNFERQVLADTRTPFVQIDGKGETADETQYKLLPVMAQRNPEVLSDLRIVRPFDRKFLPMLRITQPDPTQPRELQALSILTNLEEGVGEQFGPRMRDDTLPLVEGAIALNEPLPKLVEWLESPASLARDARRMEDSRLRGQINRLLEHGGRATRDAVLARLRLFMYWPDFRAMLSAPGCIRFPEMLERGRTIISVGNAPAGADHLVRFCGSFFMGGISRAILNRPVAPATRPAHVTIDEFPELGPRLPAEQIKRLVALCRFRRVSLWLIAQEAAQLQALDPNLLRQLHTNMTHEILFRSNFEDALALRHCLPDERGVDARDPASSVQRLVRLQTRQCFMWVKGARYPAQMMQTPRIDLHRLEAAASRAPEPALQAIARGCCAMSREELAEHMSGGSNQAVAAQPDLHLVDPVPGLDEDGESEFPSLG